MLSKRSLPFGAMRLYSRSHKQCFTTGFAHVELNYKRPRFFLCVVFTGVYLLRKVGLKLLPRTAVHVFVKPIYLQFSQDECLHKQVWAQLPVSLS